MERIQDAPENARRERNPAYSRFSLRAALANTDSSGPHFERHTYSSQVDTRRPQELIQYVNTRSVALDEHHLKANNIVGGLAHNPMSDLYRQLRSQILQKMRNQNWHTLAITSPVGGSGSTLTAVNLAISLAQEGNQTVLLADFNLRKPSVAQTLGIHDVEYGLTDYLEAGVPLEKILINPQYQRLVILPGTRSVNFSSELLSSPHSRALQHELRNRYADRIVIYDLPPLLTHDDAFVLIPEVDATLLVIEDGTATQAELERCLKLIGNNPIIGTVMNKVR